MLFVVHLCVPSSSLCNLASSRQMSDDLSLIFLSFLFVRTPQKKTVPQVVIMTAALTWARPVEP